MLPSRWFVCVGKIPTNNEEQNHEDFKKECHFQLTDVDMLVLQQNPVMDDLLTDSWFEEELDSIRKSIHKETWGEDE